MSAIRSRFPLVFNLFGGCVTGLLALAVGAAALLFGFWLRQEKRAFLGDAERASGVVVDMVAKTEEEGDTLFYPVIEFTTAEGRTVRFQAREGRWPPGYRVGDKVTLLYDPALPEYATLESSFGLRADLLVMGVGGFFLLVGFFSLVRPALWILQGAALATLGLWLWRRSDKDGKGKA